MKELPETCFPYLFAAILAAFVFTSAGPAFPQGSAREVVNCTMAVRLDPASRLVTGSETLTWRNLTGRAADEIRFQLDANVRPREVMPGYVTNRAGEETSSRGSTEVVGAFDALTGSRVAIRYPAAEDWATNDSSVLALIPSGPVPPNDSVVVRLEFRTLLPGDGADDEASPDAQTFLAAGWFPRIGVYQPDGSGNRSGWICRETNEGAGAFADFGRYDVTINVPAGYVVGATGVMFESTTDPGGIKTYRFVADDVSDFAWVAASGLIVRSHTFDVKGQAETREIFLLRPENREEEMRYAAALDSALSEFGNSYGPLPFRSLTIVDMSGNPPGWVDVSGAGPTAGSVPDMSCPGLIIARGREIAPGFTTSPEEEIVRGLAGQYWNCALSVDPRRDAWLGGGLSLYTSAELTADSSGSRQARYGFAGHTVNLLPIFSVCGVPVAAVFGKVQIRGADRFLAGFLKSEKADALARVGRGGIPEAASREPAGSYGMYNSPAYTADKAALVLTTLRGVVGDSTMRIALRNYFQESKFGHPATADFEKICAAAAGRNLDWFFDQFVYDNLSVDFAVESVTTYRETDLGTGESEYVTTVIVGRDGDARIPVDLRIRLEDGESVFTTWDGQSSRGRFEIRSHSRPVYAELDPSGRIPLDVDYSNNSRTVEPEITPVLKWVHRIFSYFQNLILTIGVL